MDDEYQEDTFVNFSLELSFSRIIGKMILPTRMTIDLGIEVFAEDESELEFAFRKIHHWCDNIANLAVIASGMNLSGLTLLLDEDNKPRLENNLMVVPSEPTDSHLMQVFRAKINAIADGAFEIISIEVNSSDSRGIAFTYVGDGEGMLPDMDEWVPGPNWFTTPWWHRNDISMIDTSAPEGTDLSDRPTWSATLDHLRDQTPSPAIVIKGDWEPTLIEAVEKPKKKTPKKK